MENKIKISAKIVYYVILVIVAVITLTPILYTICGAFKTNSEILANPENMFPKEPTFDNFITAWNSKNFNVKTMTWNSIYYTLISVAITILTSSMGGYVFARGDFYGKKVIFAILTSLMFISLGGITIYPTFEVLNLLGLSQSIWGLLVMKVFGIGIVQIYLVRSHILTLPKSIEEAAEIDGCGFIGIYFRVIMPLLKPILATIGILAFQGSWNEYLMPTIFTMSRPEQRTLIVGVMALKNSEAAASSWNLMLAGATISLIPVLFAYAVGNKYFVSGLASGAVKG
ncbi:MAG: carbohydrate ABC transporter permease [Clostridia bacterium]|nr:carbohydrate ABC transporter permease [Clostridia bacterium]